jgi:hypothetical protein
LVAAQARGNVAGRRQGIRRAQIEAQAGWSRLLVAWFATPWRSNRFLRSGSVPGAGAILSGMRLLLLKPDFG